jgi:hypothetical protein
MREAALDECRSWLSFVDGTARQDASNNRRKLGCLIVESSIHRSPGHQVDGGSKADILVGRSATKWLRLYE